GNVVVVSHENDVMTYYASLNEVEVKADSEVKQGDAIGTAGKNLFGKDNGTHVHFELRKDGKEVDPESFFNQPVSELDKIDVEEEEEAEQEGSESESDEGEDAEATEEDAEATEEEEEQQDDIEVDSEQEDPEADEEEQEEDPAADEEQDEEEGSEDEDLTDETSDSSASSASA